jgi:L-alanine-DL-glutamate epimerase-like enolase superfamily enzyme
MEERMKIRRLETRLEIDPPPLQPITDALRANRYPGRVYVTLHTDTELKGRSRMGFASVRGANETFQKMLEAEVAPLLDGRDPLAIRQIQHDLKVALEEQAIHGMTMYALAAVDVALWDILGQAAGQPVHRLVGQARDRVPAYAMIGWMHLGLDGLKSACHEAMRQGFRAVKIKTGAPALEEDLARIAAARAEVGPDCHIMVDVNQTLTVPEAIRRGVAYQEAGVFWFEEPLVARDFAGHAELAHQLALPIATGENLYGKEEFKELFVRRGIDIAQGDLARLGGFTGCLETALTASSFGLPYCTHGGGLVNLNILCALPNALYLETGALDDAAREHFVNGEMLAPEGPGFAW